MTHRGDPGGAVLITGGGGSIAAALAARLAARHVAVGLLDTDEQRLRDVVSALPAAATVATSVCDVTDWSQTEIAVGELRSALGDIARLVNLVGVFHVRPFLATSPMEWRAELLTNVLGPAHCIRAVLAGLNGERSAKVVNVCSIWATRAGRERSAYVASKHALLGLTQALATELGPAGVEFIAVSPGPVDTGMTRDAASAEVRRTWLRADDVAEMIETVCSAPDGAFAGSEIQMFGTATGYVRQRMLAHEEGDAGRLGD